MTDEAAYKLVEDFANDHTLAEDIIVTHSSFHTSYTSKSNDGARYDDCCLLKTLVDGANSFMFYLRRNGYEIVKKNKKK